MIMTVLLQVDFPLEGPFGNEMAEAFSDLAKSINEEPGFLWKIWTENQETKEAGGIYAFATIKDAETYAEMHKKRMANLGVSNPRFKIFDINEGLTRLTNGPIK
jgi:Putative mono-oxygenase ydhR